MYIFLRALVENEMHYLHYNNHVREDFRTVIVMGLASASAIAEL